MFGGVSSLLAIGRCWPLRTVRPQAMSEIIQDARDVVVEGAAREPRAGRELRIASNRFPPLLQQMLASLPEVDGQRVQLILH
jgi:hypothetical protein